MSHNLWLKNIPCIPLVLEVDTRQWSMFASDWCIHRYRFQVHNRNYAHEFWLVVQFRNHIRTMVPSHLVRIFLKIYFTYHTSHRKSDKMSTYHMVRCCKVLLRQSLLRILVWVNQFLVHRNRVRSSNFWYGVEFLKKFNFINRKISKTFKRISRISKETQKISQKKSKEKFKKFQKKLSD